MELKYWQGPIGPNDDFGAPILEVFIDGATAMGPWAIMSQNSHALYGRGLGSGRGQKYEKQKDGRWLKVA